MGSVTSSRERDRQAFIGKLIEDACYVMEGICPRCKAGLERDTCMGWCVGCRTGFSAISRRPGGMTVLTWYQRVTGCTTWPCRHVLDPSREIYTPSSPGPLCSSTGPDR